MTPADRRRRRMLVAAAAASLVGAARAQSGPLDPGWQVPERFPRPDAAGDEGGLWALMDREETRLRRSPLRLRDQALGDYLTALACRLAQQHCPDVRVHPMRVAEFNATMAPNGMMQVWSGLLLRVDNEAQLAAVLAHEIGHFLQRHTLQQLRDAKSRSAAMHFLVPFGLAGLLGQVALAAGHSGFSRDMEREADAVALRLMRDAGYDPREASTIWANLLDEVRANPNADPERGSVLFATHPAKAERRETLAALAQTLPPGGGAPVEPLRQALAPWRESLLADELRRARPHESLALFGRLLAREPGDPALLAARAEALRLRRGPGDTPAALADLDASIASGRAPATAHRVRADVLDELGQPDAARAARRRYLELAPDAADAAMIRHGLERSADAAVRP